VELYCAVTGRIIRFVVVINLTPNTGCPQTFRDVDSHVAHMHGHLPHLTAQTNTLRPALLCKPLVPEGTLPSTPAIVPLFGDPPLIIYPTFIPPEKREQLARVVSTRNPHFSGSADNFVRFWRGSMVVGSGQKVCTDIRITIDRDLLERTPFLEAHEPANSRTSTLLKSTRCSRTARFGTVMDGSLPKTW
jgi:hypothetical protein